jgi:hypothetical protein
MLAIRRLGAALALGAVAVPAVAVGLGPLALAGVTRTERKGFYLTLVNPFARAERFRLYSTGVNDEQAEARVLIPIATPMVAGRSQRRMLVVDTGLKPGEEHQFRVCAERVDRSQEGLIHARVCSKLTARRLG